MFRSLARPEPSHSGRFAFNCALPLSRRPFRRPVKALLALKADFSEWTPRARLSEIGPSRENGCELRGATRVSRGEEALFTFREWVIGP